MKKPPTKKRKPQEDAIVVLVDDAWFRITGHLASQVRRFIEDRRKFNGIVMAADESGVDAREFV